MIFITLGSQKFQFNRILIEIDKLIEEGKIEEDVFAQIGYSDYKPKNYRFKEFLDRDEFANEMSKCTIVITHGGTGAIIGAVKNEKKVIAVPRLSKYGEHVDDHQLQIISQFKDMNLIEGINKVEYLHNILQNIDNMSFNKYLSNTSIIIDEIDNFLNNI